MSFIFDRQAWQPYILDTYHWLHHMPEASWQEVKTTSFIKEQLNKFGYQTREIPGCTGVIGVRGKGPFTVALRADMDAMCHSSEVGERMIHSCGHDAHMAMVLAASGALAQMPLLDGTALKIIFQPAEEKGEGALRFIQEGFIDDVEVLFGVHLRPGEELSGGKLTPAIKHGASKTMYGEIKGVCAHGARPHLGINAIEVAMTFLQMVQNIHFDPRIPASVKMTRLTAGSEAENMIPGYGVFTLDLRAQNNEQMQKMVEQVERIAKCTSAAYGAEIKLTSGGESPAAEIDEEAQEMISRAIIDTVGQGSLVSPIITPGAEDFHYYTQQRPRIKAAMMGLGCDLLPGLHHPGMCFDTSYLLDGAEVLSRAAWYAVNNFKSGS